VQNVEYQHGGTSKLIRNGQLYIQYAEEMYGVMGERMVLEK
jgi:hypothetical protein